MATSKPVTSDEVIQAGIFEASKKDAEKFLHAINSVAEGLKLVNKQSVEYAKTNKDPRTASEVKKTAAALDAATKSRKAYVEAEAKTAKIKQQLTDAQIRESSVNKLVEKQRQDGLRATAILQSDQIGREAKLLASNTLLRIERAKLTGLEANYAEEIVRINSLLDKNTSEIKRTADAQKAQTMNVGNYTQSIIQAIDQTGVYSQIISKLTFFVETYEGITKSSTAANRANSVATEANAAAHIQNLAAVQAETQATEKLSLAKRTLNAITSPVGLLIIGVAALAGILKAVYDVNQSLQDALALGKAFAQDKFWGTGAQFRDLEASMVSLRKTIGSMTLELQQFSQDEADFTEISNDATLSLNEQNSALEESIRLGILKSQKQVEIAAKEKAIADAAVKAEESRRGVGTGNALQSFYDKQVEATKKLAEVQDELEDRDRVNSERTRSRFQQEIIDQVELLRSKKLGADAEITILTKQFNDEKNQLEERDQFNERLRSAELKAQNEEFVVFQKGAKVQIDFADLVNEKDAVQLAGKLKSLRLTSLSAAQADELAKIIKVAQENEILNNDRIAKQQTEYIARTERIEQIQRDIAKLERDQDANDLEERQKEAELLNSKRLSDIMVAERAFNRTKRQGVKVAGEEEAKLQAELAQKRLENLERDAYEAKILATKTIDDEKIRAAEIEKIDAKLQIDRQNLQEAAYDESVKLAQRNADQLKAIELKKTTITLQEVGKIASAYESELDKRNDLQSAQAEREIQNTQKNLDKQKELASKGLDNELAFQEERLAKQQLAKRQAEEKKAREKELLQTAEQFNAFLIARLNQPNADPNQALALALSDTLLAKGVAKGLVQFAAEGNDRVQGPGTQTSDSIPFMLSKDEGVVKASANMENKGVVRSLNKGTFSEMYMPRHEFQEAASEIRKSTAAQIHNSLLLQQNNEIKSILEKIEAKPVSSFDVDKLGDVIEKVHASGRTSVIVHKKTRI